jgi:murein DD-endopeptidase MepM/ murein hydrolase activator NlpD
MRYRYPFDNKKYEVKISNPTGDFSHENFQESKYALDFVLPVGTPVLAARRGLATIAKFGSDKHLSTKEIEALDIEKKVILAFKLTNLVCVDHNDGTFAEYCHLANRKAITSGQFANKGEIIGYIGMSGITDSPHLHFNVFKKKRGVVESIPVEFIV